MIKLEIETIIGLMPGMNSVSSHTAYGQSYGGGYDQSSYGYSTGYAAAAQGGNSTIFNAALNLMYLF